MPDILNLNLDAFAERLREFAQRQGETLKQRAEDAIEEAKKALEGAEQIRLIPELFKDALIAWVAEAEVNEGTRIDGGELRCLGINAPHVTLHHSDGGRGAELPAGRYRFFLVAFPVEFPSEAGEE